MIPLVRPSQSIRVFLFSHLMVLPQSILEGYTQHFLTTISCKLAKYHVVIKTDLLIQTWRISVIMLNINLQWGHQQLTNQSFQLAGH